MKNLNGAVNKKLTKDFSKIKENLRQILVGSQMREICYNETFRLIFKPIDNYYMHKVFSLIIDAPCWFGDRVLWETRIKDSAIIGYEDCYLAEELVRLRYSNLTFVKEVDIFDEYIQITFCDNDKLCIAHYSQSEYSWLLDEVCDKAEADRISIFCQGNELYQNNIE